MSLLMIDALWLDRTVILSWVTQIICEGIKKENDGMVVIVKAVSVVVDML